MQIGSSNISTKWVILLFLLFFILFGLKTLIEEYLERKKSKTDVHSYRHR